MIADKDDLILDISRDDTHRIPDRGNLGIDYGDEG
jgi:hypothetical protein